MIRWEWIFVPLVICNLLGFSFKSIAQISYLPSCDSIHEEAIVIDSTFLSEMSMTAYEVLKNAPQMDSTFGQTMHLMIHQAKSLESQSDIRSRLLAQRMRLAIDQAILVYAYYHRNRLERDTATFLSDTKILERLLFENQSSHAIISAYKSAHHLEEITGIPEAWVREQLLFPSPQSELQMIKLLLAGRLEQENQAENIRTVFKASLASEQEVSRCLLIQSTMLPEEYAFNLLGRDIRLERLFMVNIFHLLYPFIGDEKNIKNELSDFYMPDVYAEPYNKERLESIQVLGGSWLHTLNLREITKEQVEQLLFANPFEREVELAEFEILTSQGARLFPYYSLLLSETNNRLLLSRIIHVLTGISDDKSEIIPEIRSKLFELYFLYKGEFLSSEQLMKEFSYMSLLEGGDLMLLLVGDKDQRIRLSALQRLAEIGDSYTYKTLEKILLYSTYHGEKKTRKQAEESLSTIYNRVMPPDPLEISLSSTNLDGQNLSNYAIVADQMPQFPGGSEALSQYLAKRTKPIRKLPMEGIVMLRFVVDTKGSLSDIQIVKSLHPLYDQRAVSIVKSMPRWKPGMKENQIVAVSQHLTIAFRL